MIGINKSLKLLFVLLFFVLIPSIAFPNHLYMSLINMPDYYIGGSDNLVVAVVDSGIFYQEFTGYNILDGYDFVDSDNMPIDTNGHGTAITNIILSVAPNITILPIRVLNADGIGTSQNIASGLSYASLNGAKVINMSLSFGFDYISYEVEREIQYAYEKGISIIAASGNDFMSMLPYPANSLLTVSVGAIKNNLRRLEMSNYGTMLDLVAPGEKVFDLWTGTSFACPFVTGAVALIYSEDPFLNQEQIKWILWESSSEIFENDILNEYGAGLLNVSRALYLTKNNLYPHIDPITTFGQKNLSCFIEML